MPPFHSPLAGDPVPAVVFGTGKNALGVCRSLGRRGVPVTLVNANPLDLAGASRFCTVVTSPHPGRDPEPCVDLLLGLSTQWSVHPVLIPTGDVEVDLVSRARHRLGERFAFRMAEAHVVAALVRKDEFAALAKAHGLDVPGTHVVRDLSTLDAAAREVTYPCVVKPAFSPAWRDPSIREALARVTGGRAKRVIARSPDELRRVYAELVAWDPCVVVQEYVEGGDDCLYDVYTYLDAATEPAGLFMIRKLRTFPVDGNGSGTCVESVWQPELAEVALEFLRAIRYRGNSAVCFKRSARTGRFRVIEVNARLAIHHALATHCGVDLAFMAYLDALDLPIPPAHGGPGRAKWLSLRDDIRAFRVYRNRRELTLGGWLSSLRGLTIECFLSRDDPRPFIAHWRRRPSGPVSESAGPARVRRSVRRWLGMTLYYSGLVALLRRARSRRADGPAILRYHSVAGSPDLSPGLVVSSRNFRAHLRYLVRHYTVMPLDRVVDLMAEGRPLARSVAVVTLDDGFRDNYEQALPILRELGCPATIFVLVEPVATGGVPWPQRLYTLIHHATVPELRFPSTPVGEPAYAGRRFDLRTPEAGDVARRALKWLAGALDAPERETFIAQVAEGVAPRDPGPGRGVVAMLSWEQLRELDRQGVTIGSHTMTHPRLGCLDSASAAREVGEARRLLEAALGHDVRLFAYPFGRWADLSVEAKRAVIAGGYRAACTTVEGLAGPRPDLFALRRLKVRDEPVWRFALRLVVAGQTSGLLAWILDGERA